MKKKRVSKKADAGVAEGSPPAPPPPAEPAATNWLSWLREHQLPPGIEPPEPEVVNHALLVAIQEIARDTGLGPCALERRGSLSRQHQRKLAPKPPGEKETHITLVSTVRWLSPWRVDLAAFLEEVIKRMRHS